MEKLKIAVIGCGFWAHYQIAAWGETNQTEIIALCDKNVERAQKLASKYGIKAVYTDAEKLIEEISIDCVDIITSPETHADLVYMIAQKGIDIICQKPMANDLDTAQQMVNACKEAAVNFFIHENFRWQAPMRKIKQLLMEGAIGKVFKSRIAFCSAFPVFDNQPFLKELDRFIISDVGSHVLDVARFLFGEVQELMCYTNSINEGIKGEDVATVLMQMKDGSHSCVEMSYASILEKEAFPQTLMLIEGAEGSIQLSHDCIIKITTKQGTEMIKAQPENYSWLNPDYAVVHASMVGINNQFAEGLLQGKKVETTGLDNLETLKLVYACYDSAEKGQLITIQ